MYYLRYFLPLSAFLFISCGEKAKTEKNSSRAAKVDCSKKKNHPKCQEDLDALGQQTVDNGRLKDGYLHRSFPHF